MTNKARYQKTFAVLHASRASLEEVKRMQANHTYRPVRVKRLVAVCAALVALFALSAVAYAADVGGIQRTIQIWLHGELTDAVFQVENGSYTLDISNEDGTTSHRAGGGVAIDAFGGERPLTEEELLTQLDHPEVQYNDDGTVVVYYRDQSFDITDLFDEDGVCYLQLEEDGHPLYMTVEYQIGYSTSTSCYPAPSGSSAD